MESFGENLQHIRKARKIRQSDIAAHLGIAVRTYQSYEYGEREPDIATLKRLADYFGVTTDYLLGRAS